MTCALNAANEKANELFREGKFDFFGIPKVSLEIGRMNDPP